MKWRSLVIGPEPTCEIGSWGNETGRGSEQKRLFKKTWHISYSKWISWTTYIQKLCLGRRNYNSRSVSLWSILMSIEDLLFLGQTDWIRERWKSILVTVFLLHWLEFADRLAIDKVDEDKAELYKMGWL